MTFKNPSNETLREILESAQNIAVVGLSNRPDRTSYKIASAMKQAGYRIIPVNPNITETLGEVSYPSLEAVDQPIDIINVFRKSEFLPELAQQAVRAGAKVFWAQQGVYNEDAYKYLREHDQLAVMDMCIKVAHSLLVKR